MLEKAASATYGVFPAEEAKISEWNKRRGITRFSNFLSRRTESHIVYILSQTSSSCCWLLLFFFFSTNHQEPPFYSLGAQDCWRKLGHYLCGQGARKSPRRDSDVDVTCEPWRNIAQLAFLRAKRWNQLQEKNKSDFCTEKRCSVHHSVTLVAVHYPWTMGTNKIGQKGVASRNRKILLWCVIGGYELNLTVSKEKSGVYSFQMNS